MFILNRTKRHLHLPTSPHCAQDHAACRTHAHVDSDVQTCTYNNRRAHTSAKFLRYGGNENENDSSGMEYFTYQPILPGADYPPLSYTL